MESMSSAGSALPVELGPGPAGGKIWELEGDFDSESESWDSAPQAPRSKETGAPQARGTLADLGFLVRVWRVKAVFFSRISALVGVKLRE
jgi:hypothetical protein